MRFSGPAPSKLNFVLEKFKGEESFDTIFNMGNGLVKSPMGVRVKSSRLTLLVATVCPRSSDPIHI